MAKIANFYRGDTKVFNLTITNADRTPKDLTGATIYFTMKKSKNDADAQAMVAKTANILGLPTNGEAQVTLTSSDTINLPVSDYFYDFRMKQSTGVVTTLLSDVVSLLSDVTRRVAP